MKRLLNFNLIFSCVALLYATSCTTYYVPNSQEIPLFTAKNQGRAGVGLAYFPEGTKAFKYSGSYSFTDHFGATANMFFVSDADNHARKDHGITTPKGTSAGLGLVHFLPVGENYVFESTLGFAGGNARNSSVAVNSTTIENKVHFFNIFIQPSIGLAKKHFEMALSLKYNIHTYTDLNSTLINDAKVEPNYNEAFDKTYYNYPINKTFHFLEPAITIRYGWERIKLSFQFIPSFLIGNADFDRENANASLGIHFKFGGKSED